MFKFTALLIFFSVNSLAAVIKEVDLAGSDAGLAYTEHDTIMLTSPIQYLGWGIVEEFERRHLNDVTTKGAVGTGNDLRMDLLYGAKGQISLGYLTNNYTSVVKVYDENDNLLTLLAFEQGETYLAANPEYPWVPGVDQFLPANDGQLDITFDGTAAYLVFDFDDQNTATDPYESFQIDNLRYETAQDEILERFTGAVIEHAAQKEVGSQKGLVESFNLHVTDDGIGTIAPMFIESSLLGDYTISVKGSGGLTGFSVVQPFYQIDNFDNFNLLFSDQILELFVSKNPFNNLDMVVNNLELRGLEDPNQIAPNISIFQALFFEGEGDFVVTLTSVAKNVNAPTTTSLMLGLVGLLMIRCRRMKMEKINFI